MEFRSCPPEEEENHRENCQGASILSSMSAFQRLMDSSPFLLEKDLPATSTKEDVTPQEFNSKSGDSSPPDCWVDRSAARPDANREPFSDSCWYLTTSITRPTTLTTGPGPAQSTARSSRCRASAVRSRPRLAQNRCGKPAWACTPSTRESPVHTAINHGDLSSLFSITYHSPVGQDTFQKRVRTANRCTHWSPARARWSPS
ncbi:hypothetical protein ABFV05_006649 [Capra hircus]